METLEQFLMFCDKCRRCRKVHLDRKGQGGTYRNGSHGVWKIRGRREWQLNGRDSRETKAMRGKQGWFLIS